jgi:hypothetical protein
VSLIKANPKCSIPSPKQRDSQYPAILHRNKFIYQVAKNIISYHQFWVIVLKLEWVLEKKVKCLINNPLIRLRQINITLNQFLKIAKKDSDLELVGR